MMLRRSITAARRNQKSDEAVSPQYECCTSLLSGMQMMNSTASFQAECLCQSADLAGWARRFSRMAILFFLPIGTYAAAQLPPPPKAPRVDSNGVDVRTGNPVFSRAELDIGPPGEYGLHFARYLGGGIFRDSFDSTYYEVNTMDAPYQSINVSFGPAGDSFGSWGVGPGAYISYDTNFVPIYRQKNGTKVFFGLNIWDHYGSYGDNSEDKYRLADSVVYSNGVVWTIHYKVEPMTYYPATRIQSVTTNTGYQIKFTYQSNIVTAAGWGTRISAKAINNAIEYCDPDADSCTLSHPWPTVSYSSTTTGTPTSPPVISTTSVTDAMGGVTVYRASSGATSTWSVTNPGSSVENIKYIFNSIPQCVPNPFNPPFACSMGSNQRVVSAVLPSKTTSYAYNVSAGLVTSTEPGGVTNKYYSQNILRDGEYAVVQWVDPLNRVYNFQTNQDGLETQAQWPELNYVSSTRDAAGNAVDEIAYAKPSSGAAALARHQTFDPCTINSMTCDKPRTVTDPKGNVTAFDYNARGQILSEVGPPNTHNVRQVKLFAYTDLYAYVKNSAGAMVAAATPVSMLTSETVCEGAAGSSAAACSTAAGAVKVVTTYEYGAPGSPNTLLRRAKIVDQGAGKLNLRTCYGYDDYGNITFETSPRAGLASCS